MTEQEKQLLLADLCAKLPYGIIMDNGNKINKINTFTQVISGQGTSRKIEHVKPYLRPMSSMTEEELNELLEFEDIDYNNNSNVVKRAMMAFSEDKRIESNSLFCIQYARSIDWLNTHHFDYRGLIEKGLALEAPKDMYNTKYK